MAQTVRKERQSNMELLRIVAMLMIITLHYLDKGNVLPGFTESSTLNHHLAWWLEACCYGAVNLYVLISGYFMAESKFTFKKLAILWLQILFYSWVIGVICFATGLVGVEQKSLYELIFIAFPVTSAHYWFATVYVLLFALSPFLNVCIANMNRKQHKACIAVAVIVFSAWNTVLPFTNALTDREGMDIPWFICLYVIAAYLKKYPDCIKGKKVWYLLGYFSCSTLVFLFGFGCMLAEKTIGKLGGYATMLYAYNSLAVLASSLCLFVYFTKLKISGKGIGNVINTVAAATFGVYLIHEHRYLRYLWPQWLGVEANADKSWMILHWFGSIILIFVLCAVLEWIRKRIFVLVTERQWFGKLFAPLRKAEQMMNGDME